MDNIIFMPREFLSTLSLRRATRGAVICYLDNIISIHALLAESDQLAARDDSIMFVFLSTLSLRRATISCQYVSSDFWDFYPRSPCGERRDSAASRPRNNQISIHALLAESDKINLAKHTNLSDFYPRSPCGERPGVLYCHLIPSKDFYPRSPCGERLGQMAIHAIHKYFYPRSPCGERLASLT